LNVAVPGLTQLVFGGQVEPELKTLHHTFFLLGHLAVYQAASCGHPLHTTVLQQAFMATAVTMPHATRDHVGHGLKTAVRVVGKTGNVVVGFVAAKGIEHQKRVQALLQIV